MAGKMVVEMADLLVEWLDFEKVDLLVVTMAALWVY